MTDPYGLYAEALATVEEASLHGYSQNAAFQAAVDHLELADRNEAIMIAGLLASWIATDLNPETHVTDLTTWLDLATAAVAGRGADE